MSRNDSNYLFNESIRAQTKAITFEHVNFLKKKCVFEYISKNYERKETWTIDRMTSDIYFITKARIISKLEDFLLRSLHTDMIEVRLNFEGVCIYSFS